MVLCSPGHLGWSWQSWSLSHSSWGASGGCRRQLVHLTCTLWGGRLLLDSWRFPCCQSGNSSGAISMLCWWYLKEFDLLCQLGDLLEWYWERHWEGLWLSEQLECLLGEKLDLCLVPEWLHLDLISLSGVICLNVWVIWLCTHRRGDGVFGYVCTGQHSDSGHHSCSTPCHESGTCMGVGVATPVALWEGYEGILVDEGHWGGHCRKGGEVCPVLLLGLLVLLTDGFKQLAMGEKNLVGQLGWVLEPDPVLGFVEPHCMLEDSSWENLHWLMRAVFLVFRAWMPSLGSWCIPESSSSQKCQK